MKAMRVGAGAFLVSTMIGFGLIHGWVGTLTHESGMPVITECLFSAGDGPGGMTVQTDSRPFLILGPISLVWAVFLSCHAWAERRRLLKTRRKVRDLERIKIDLEERMEGLERAGPRVAGLEGLLPICSACKKIRDEGGEWSRFESYVGKRLPVQFTHSICPDCARRLYPELYAEALREGREARRREPD